MRLLPCTPGPLLAACLAAGLLAAAGAQPVVREILLRGAQDGTYPAAEYLVDSAVVVPGGKTMTIAAGSVLRFEKYASLKVQGRLVTEGTPAAIVLFTSDNHRPPAAGRPAPGSFDWNGILVAPNGCLRLNYSRVAYSTMGIKCEAPQDSLTLDNVAFSHNGTQSLSVGDSVIQVPASTMVTIGTRPAAPAVDTVAPAKAPPAREAAWKWPVRIGGAAVLLGAGALAAYSQVRISDLERQYDTSSVSSVTDRIKKDRNQAAVFRAAGIGFAVLGAAGLTVTFVF